MRHSLSDGSLVSCWLKTIVLAFDCFYGIAVSLICCNFIPPNMPQLTQVH
jgi:hypothetical protein